MPSLKAWLQQPTTILGLGSLIGTLAGLVAHVLTHDTTITVAAGGASFAITHVILPDNSAAPKAVDTLVMDAVQALVTKQLAASLPKLFTDAVAVEQAITSPAPFIPTPNNGASV